MRHYKVMLMLSSIVILSLCFGFIRTSIINRRKPEQVHIAFGEDPCSSVSITWSTKDPVPEPRVQYGMEELDQEAAGLSKAFEDGGQAKRVQYIHRVTLSGLAPATTYVYRCGSRLGWSERFSFRTDSRSRRIRPLSLAVYGDMGATHAAILPAIQQAVGNNSLDAIIHVGDFAYDMHDDDGRVGDEFLQLIEPVSANVPYMVCPGNHERAYNFSHYRERFTMPGNSESLFYSFNLGPAHFISINTEAYYYLNYGDSVLINQYNWLVNDLREANTLENRGKHPWIIVFGHRPMYCSNLWLDDCSMNTTRTRIGLPIDERYQFGLEDLFYKNGVDLMFWGDEHTYERLFPIYDYSVRNGSYQNPYTDPKAPIHITTGTAGSKHALYDFTDEKPDWSAMRIKEFGYNFLEIHNHTHVHIQRIPPKQGAEPDDDFWIITNYHGPFEYDYHSLLKKSEPIL